jgi:cobalamin biosynthesis protein CbiD
VTDSPWHPAENGVTLGQTGSEQGVTLHDEEHDLGARITLERDTRVAPFAITCGIYGWMLHTRFLGSEDEAQTQYGLMKNAIGELLEEAERSAGIDGGRKILMDGCSKFVETFP